MNDSADCTILEAIRERSLDAPNKYQHKAVLYIGSESYCAPTITILQGLQEMEWIVYTINKPAINSWFVNQVVQDPDQVDFDFVLSNLGWGTRWSYYEKFGLHDHRCVLIDGDDDPYCLPWREKYDGYKLKYVYEPEEATKNMYGIMPFRWVEYIGAYDPDVVFTSQRCTPSTYYLPFGVHREYSRFYGSVSTDDRKISFANFPGLGDKRVEMRGWLTAVARQDLIHGRLFNSKAYGELKVPEGIHDFCLMDHCPNIHGYHRWSFPKDYFGILNASKFAIHPGVTPEYWESKRQYEALASGCLPLFEDPGEWTSQYPIQEIWPDGFYTGKMDFVDRLMEFDKMRGLNELQGQVFGRAMRYFAPIPLARYFLERILLCE